MNFRQFLRASTGGFLLTGTHSSTARLGQRYAFRQSFPVSDILEDYIQFVQEYHFGDDLLEWDLAALQVAWEEYEQKELAWLPTVKILNK